MSSTSFNQTIPSQYIPTDMLENVQGFYEIKSVLKVFVTFKLTHTLHYEISRHFVSNRNL